MTSDTAPLPTSDPGRLPSRWRQAPAFLAVLWTGAVVAATMQQGVSHPNNNFSIFRAAARHLVDGADLYAAYPALHSDLFKYSPTFALLFLPLALLPFAFAMLCWNVLNAGLLWLAIGRVLRPRGATVARAIVFMDMLGSLQNAQSNALVAALIILAFAGFEEGHESRATALVSIGTSIKLFPLAAATFAVFHGRLLRVAIAGVLCAALLVALPLLVTSPHLLAAQYASWRAVESADTLERGFTVMQLLELAFRHDWPSWPIQLVGVITLVAPLLARRHRWPDRGFRLVFLCSVLVFCVLFNHQSESPTFVIAVSGAAIWFATRVRWTRATWALFAFVVTCTILASSDAMPHAIQRALFDRYHFKTVPMLVLWLVLQRELWRSRTPASAQLREGGELHVTPGEPLAHLG